MGFPYGEEGGIFLEDLHEDVGHGGDVLLVIGEAGVGEDDMEEFVPEGEGGVPVLEVSVEEDFGFGEFGLAVEAFAFVVPEGGDKNDLIGDRADEEGVGEGQHVGYSP